MRFKRPAIAIAFLALIAAAFQNCTQAVKQGSKTETSVAQNNGTGYGGKVFVVRVSTGLCADGSDILTRIVTIDEKSGIKNRDACRDIPGIQVSLDAPDVYKSMQINHSANPYDVLVVGGQIFDLDGGNSRTTRFCHGFMDVAEGVRKTDVLIRETGNTSNGHFESAVFGPRGDLVLNSTHYSLSFEPTRTLNGPDEYYYGEFGPAGTIELLVAQAAGGFLSGRVSLPSESIDQTGMTCYGAD